MTSTRLFHLLQKPLLTFSTEALEQAEAGWRKIHREFDATENQTVNRIRQALSGTPATLPQAEGIRFGTETGNITYASLLYATPADAAAAFDSATVHSYVYLRDGSVAGNTLSKAVQALDPAAVDARVTAFGMSAIGAALSVLSTGDHIVASSRLFGTTKTCLLDFPRSRGIAVTFVDGRDTAAWQKAILPGTTKAFFYEPVANPTGEVTDTATLATLARPHDILLVADSSATPLGEFLAQGADVIALSLTKFVGLGDSCGGAVLVAQTALEKLGRQRPDVDVTSRNPFLDVISAQGWNQAAEVSERHLERMTLAPVRHQRQVATARHLVNWINRTYEVKILSSALTHPNLPAVHAQIFALDFGTQARAYAFAEKLGARAVNNFGGPVTSFTIPRSTTHKALPADQLDAQGIGEGLIRLSIGVEAAEYLQHELVLAFEHARIPRRPDISPFRSTLSRSA